MMCQQQKKMDVDEDGSSSEDSDEESEEEPNKTPQKKVCISIHILYLRQGSLFLYFGLMQFTYMRQVKDAEMVDAAKSEKKAVVF